MKEKLYKFKSFVSGREAAEVMKQIKYHQVIEGVGPVISEESYKAFPQLQTYFEEYEYEQKD